MTFNRLASEQSPSLAIPLPAAEPDLNVGIEAEARRGREYLHWKHVAKHLNEYLKLGNAASPAESTSTGIVAPVVLPVMPQQTNPSEPTNAPGTTLLLPTASMPVQNAQESVSARDNPTMPLAKTTGTVSITSTPDGADIFLDSVGSGHAPLILKVNSGMHAVQLTKSGYKDFVSEVMVTPDGIVNVTATLAK